MEQDKGWFLTRLIRFTERRHQGQIRSILDRTSQWDYQTSDPRKSADFLCEILEEAHKLFDPNGWGPRSPYFSIPTIKLPEELYSYYANQEEVKIDFGGEIPPKRILLMGEIGKRINFSLRYDDHSKNPISVWGTDEGAKRLIEDLNNSGPRHVLEVVGQTIVAVATCALQKI